MTGRVQELQRDVGGVMGLGYLPGYLTVAEEEELLAIVNRSPWSDTLKRRVQHYGWRYDYKARRIDDNLHLGPLPAWADALAMRLVDDGLVPDKPDQVIVNEYLPGQGISAHIDCPPCFADGIVSLSLGWPYEMEFSRPDDKRKIQLFLERGSALILCGPARYEWRHAIRARQRDGDVPRQTRVSLTFRKVIRT